MQTRSSVAVFVLILFVIAGLSVGFTLMHFGTSREVKRAQNALSALQDSVLRFENQIASLKEQVPGLGEYMTTNQLHLAKVWYAGQSQNWDLALYELNELDETMEAAEALHAVKNKVDITGVLESIRQTQVAALRSAIDRKKLRLFSKAYSEQVAACNGCHLAAGYRFIHITRPTAPPVTNQTWERAPNG